MLDQRQSTQMICLSALTPLNMKHPQDSTWSLPPIAAGPLPVPKVFSPSQEVLSFVSMPVPHPMKPLAIPDQTHPELQHPPQSTKPNLIPSPALPMVPKSQTPPRAAIQTRSSRKAMDVVAPYKYPHWANRFDGIYSKYLSSCPAPAKFPLSSRFSFFYAACGAPIKISFFPAHGKNDPDTLAFDKAMKDNPDIWMKAVTDEVRALETHKPWIEVSTSALQHMVVSCYPDIWYN